LDEYLCRPFPANTFVFPPRRYTNLNSKIERGDKEEVPEAYIVVGRGANDEGNRVI
jgi:hypothetical protein